MKCSRGCYPYQRQLLVLFALSLLPTLVVAVLEYDTAQQLLVIIDLLLVAIFMVTLLVAWGSRRYCWGGGVLLGFLVFPAGRSDTRVSCSSAQIAAGMDCLQRARVVTALDETA